MKQPRFKPPISQPISSPIQEIILDYLPLIIFAGLLFLTITLPATPIFDENHYLPAVKKIIQFQELANFEHPPLAKLIMGVFWLLFHKLLGASEVVSVRIPVAIAGLGVLLIFFKILKEAGFSRTISRALLWTIPLNLCWYVQSKIAMTDMIFLFFSLLSIYLALQKKFTLSGALFGAAMACKWSAAPYAIILFYLARGTSLRTLARAVVSGLTVYCMCFLPLVFIHNSPLSLTNIFSFHLKMYEGISSAGHTAHPYNSSWWQWLILNRPMWYDFASLPTSTGAASGLYSCVFMGGNPFIFLMGTAAILYSIANYTKSYFLGSTSLRKSSRNSKRKATHRLNTWPLRLFGASMFLWVLSLKSTNFFYYVVPASLWFGPAIASVLLTRYTETQTKYTLWVLNGFSAAFFVFMLPITSGSAVPIQTFHNIYRSWMAALNWI